MTLRKLRTPGEFLRCAIYCRVSSDAQEKQNTIASQLRILPEYAAKRGWQVIELYVDNGFSGSTIEGRPAFSRLLTDVEAGKIDVVLVIDVDRITRSGETLQRALIFDSFRKAGVQLATPSQMIDLQDDSQSMTTDILGAVAAYERRKIVGRTSRGKKEKVEQGVFRCGPDPYGFKWNAQRKAYDLVEEEAAVVRHMYQLIRQHGLVMLTWHLNQQGYKTRKGRKWNVASVTKIMKESTYCGKYRIFKGQGLPPMTMPEIIDPATWHEVQSLIKVRRLHQRGLEPNFLSGLLRCGICGASMWRMNAQKDHKFSYWRCRSTNNWRKKGWAGPCGQRHHRQHELEDAIWTAVCQTVRTMNLSVPGVDEVATKARIAELDELEQETLVLCRKGKITKVNRDKEVSEISRERALLYASLAEEPVAIAGIDLAALDDLDKPGRRQVLEFLGGVTIYKDGRVEVGEPPDLPFRYAADAQQPWHQLKRSVV